MAKLYGAGMDRVVAGVLLGGVAGATGRWAVGEIGWPTWVSLLVVNTVGCAVLGWVVARWAEREHPVRLALGVGLCGGFTTFSGLAVELAQLLDGGELVGACALAVGSVVFGLGAFWSIRQRRVT